MSNRSKLVSELFKLVCAQQQKTNLSKDQCKNLKTAQGIKANGFKELMCEKGTESRFGQTDRSTKAGGKTIPRMAEADLFMQTETYLRENGKMIKLTDREFTHT